MPQAISARATPRYPDLHSLKQPTRTFFWTAPVSDSSELTNEDPLGLDYVAQQVGLLLLPTLTTRSTRAQGYAMVLYGLRLAAQAIEQYGYPNTEEQKRKLFERWECFWAIATLEYREGPLPRGDSDAMRGIRGVTAAWRPGEGPLPVAYTLISRQQELGNLGAYLAPLRRSGLIYEGTLQPTPVALEILDNFWDEREENARLSVYETYALVALEPSRASINRKNGNLTLARVGERSRLSSLNGLNRTQQQRRLYTAIFEQARDPTTLAVATLVENASKAGVTSPRDIIDGAIEGRFGAVEPGLEALLKTSRGFGDFMDALLGAFDSVYTAIDHGGWTVDRGKVAASVFTPTALKELHTRAERLLETPAVSEIGRFPMHGAACLRLATELRGTDAQTALDLLLAYHRTVQRDRRRGAGWIREDGDKLVLVVTSYTARPDASRFPSFKFDAVRALLTDMGQLPFHGEDADAEESE